MCTECVVVGKEEKKRGKDAFVRLCTGGAVILVEEICLLRFDDAFVVFFLIFDGMGSEFFMEEVLLIPTVTESS